MGIVIKWEAYIMDNKGFCRISAQIRKARGAYGII